MYKILTLNNISTKGLERLSRERFEVASEIQHPDAILVRSHDMHRMSVPSTLKAVARAGAGINNIPVEALSQRGIAVFNAPGANANAVKELVVAGMLIACRNLCDAAQFAAGLEGSEGNVTEQVEIGKKKFVGFELPGRTLGVVGLGAVGVQVANAAYALGMKVIGYDPGITVERAWQLAADVDQALTIDDLLGRVDFVTFHVPLMEETRGTINAERLRRMKDRVVILNFSRAGIVDDAAVCQAIDDGKVYAYICDFPSPMLVNHDRVVTLPHLGASTVEAEENCAVMVVDQLVDYLENGNVKNSVNFPDVHLRRVSDHRVAVVNENRPDMVGQISHQLGLAGLNIEHMVNESRNDLAYTLIDADKAASQETIKRICGIEGVLDVRTF
jgi:D-3-phosphoglycerate dehydrogenase